MRFDDYKFRASCIGKIMTDSRTKDPLGETCKAYLLECYIESVYGRKKEFKNKYIEKGLAVEEGSLTLYSRCTKTFYKKNTEHLSNGFVCGTPDIITDNEVIDIKSSWDIFTYFGVFHKPVNKDYIYQLQTYMALTGKKSAKLVYCLVDTPEPLINDAKFYLAKDMGVIDNQAHPAYIEACKQIEKEMTFGDIEMKDRYVEFLIPYKADLMDAVYERIALCRNFMNELFKSKTTP